MVRRLTLLMMLMVIITVFIALHPAVASATTSTNAEFLSMKTTISVPANNLASPLTANTNMISVSASTGLEVPDATDWTNLFNLSSTFGMYPDGENASSSINTAIGELLSSTAVDDEYDMMEVSVSELAMMKRPTMLEKTNSIAWVPASVAIVNLVASGRSSNGRPL